LRHFISFSFRPLIPFTEGSPYSDAVNFKTRILFGLVVIGVFSSANAQRVGFLPLEGELDAYNLAVPTAVSRALESVDGLVAPTPFELYQYLRARPENADRLSDSYALDYVVSGKVSGSAGAYSLELSVKKVDGGASDTLVAKGSDFKKLVATADATLIRALGLKPSTDDSKEILSIETALPTPEVVVAAVTPGAKDSVGILEKAGANAWALGARGLLLSQTGKAADAVPLAAQAAKLAPLDASVMMVSGVIQLQAKKNSDAKTVIDAGLKLNPAKPELHYLQGLRILRGADKLSNDILQSATNEFKTALEYNPRFLEAALNVADIFERYGGQTGWQTAEAVLLNLEPRMPDELELHNRLISLYLNNDRDTATRYLRGLVRDTPDVPDTVYALASRLPNLEQALAIVTKGDAAYPDSSALAFARGAILEHQGQYANAAKAYQTAISRDDTNVQALTGLAYANAKLGRDADAEAALKKAAGDKFEPRLTARMYLLSGRLDKAGGLVDGLVKSNPTVAEYVYWSGIGALWSGRFDDAQKAFEASLKQQTDFENARQAMAFFMPERRKIGVLKLTGEALKSYQLGLALLDLGNSLDALEAQTAFQKALASDPNNAQLKFFVAQAMYKSGNTDDAIDLFNEVLTTLDTNVAVMTALAVAYADQGRFDRTLELLGKATKTDPKYSLGWYFSGVMNFGLAQEEAVAGTRNTYLAAAKDAFTKSVGIDSYLKTYVQPYLTAIK
jgi:tetratricopeptide (TPR) repeat protein